MFNLIYKARNNRGQAMVIVVIVIPVLIAFIFYVAGVGDIIKTKIHLQNVADSAAVSAATWQARGLNVLVAMNNAIEACYISIALMLPAYFIALAAGAGGIALLLFEAIMKCWKTALNISKIQCRFAQIPWSAIAFSEAMYIIKANNSSGIAIPIPSFRGIGKKDHASGLYTHRATREELMRPPKKKKENNLTRQKGMKTVEVPNEYDLTVKKTIWRQKWKQRATYNSEKEEYEMPWKKASKVGRFYGSQLVDEDDRYSYPYYPVEYKTFAYFPDDYEDDEIVSWRVEGRLTSYNWPDMDPPRKQWYINAPEITSDVVIIWPEAWSHPEEGYRWGYSVHDSFWCYKWEPVFKDNLYSLVDDIRELSSKFSMLGPHNTPLPWVRDEDISHDEACITMTYKSLKDIFLWKYISNVFGIKPPVVYSISQARVFRRTRKKYGMVKIKKVSNEMRDMLLSFPPYGVGIEKVNLNYLISQDIISKVESLGIDKEDLMDIEFSDISPIKDAISACLMH